MAGKKLDERQTAFLAYLFDDECAGDKRKAATKAGYPKNMPMAAITKPLTDEIIELTRQQIVAMGPEAVARMNSLLRDPAQLGARNSLQAFKEIMDRMGVVKPEKVEIEAKGGVMILPAKSSDD